MRDSHWRDQSRSNYSTNQAYPPTSPRQPPKSTTTSSGLLDDVPDYGSAFVCGKSRFESEKFHVKNDPILQVSCGDEHTGVITRKLNLLNVFLNLNKLFFNKYRNWSNFYVWIK